MCGIIVYDIVIRGSSLSKLKRWEAAAAKKAHRKAQAKFQKKPSEVEKRENRNQARYQMMKEGKVHKGDGKDVMHEDGNAMNNSPKNWKAGSRKKNRSFKRNKDGSKADPRS